MSITRVIPILLLSGEGLVKTTKFKNPVYLGDPINALRIFNEKEVDELVLFDIDAAKKKRQPNYEWIRDLVSECFMPIGYGGGIDSIDKAKRIFDIGVEKVVINTSSFDYNFIENLSAIYGSQSVVVCIDVKKSYFGNYKFYTRSGQTKGKVDPVNHAINVVKAGCGEIIIQSIDKEGTMGGFDSEITKMISDCVDVPVVASGGAGSISDFDSVLKYGNASAVAAGSLFVYKGIQKGILINYPTEIIREKFIDNG